MEREVNLIVHLLTEVDIVLLEAIEAEDEHGGRFVELKLRFSLSVLLALRAVPSIAATEAFWRSELLQALVDRLLFLDLLRLTLQCELARMVTVSQELVNTFFLLD